MKIYITGQEKGDCMGRFDCIMKDQCMFHNCLNGEVSAEPFSKTTAL
jgi:hypothetical protein